MDRRTSSVEILHERLESAGVCEHVVLVLALIDELDAHARIEERQLAQSFREDVVVEADVGEDLRAWLEADGRTAVVRLAHNRERSHGLAQVVLLAVELAIASNRELEVVRKRIDHRHAYPVQPTGYLVG